MGDSEVAQDAIAGATVGAALGPEGAVIGGAIGAVVGLLDSRNPTIYGL